MDMTDGILGKTALAALILFSISLSCAAEDRIDAALRAAVEGFPAAAQGRTVVSLGNFTYSDKKIGSPFSRYLSEKIGAILARSGRYEYFNREKLDEVLKAAELGMSDLFDPNTAVPVNLQAVQAVLSGTFFDAGTTVKVFLELQDVGSGGTRGKTEADLPKGDIPAGVAVLPENYAGALSVLEELGAIQGSSDLKVRIWTDRGDGGTYRDGERLVVNFFASMDCYIRIFHIDVNGTMKLIFPNQYFTDNLVRAKRIYKIPDASYPFTFDLGAPFGTEFIKVVASTAPFTDRVEAFEDLGKAAQKVATRGLNVNLRQKLVTEGLLNYAIVK